MSDLNKVMKLRQDPDGFPKRGIPSIFLAEGRKLKELTEALFLLDFEAGGWLSRIYISLTPVCAKVGRTSSPTSFSG